MIPRSCDFIVAIREGPVSPTETEVVAVCLIVRRSPRNAGFGPHLLVPQCVEHTMQTDVRAPLGFPPRVQPPRCWRERVWIMVVSLGIAWVPHSITTPAPPPASRKGSPVRFPITGTSTQPKRSLPCAALVTCLRVSASSRLRVQLFLFHGIADATRATRSRRRHQLAISSPAFPAFSARNCLGQARKKCPAR